MHATATQQPATQQKGYKGIAMEGMIARWYARTRGSASQIAQWRAQAAELTADLPDGAGILEVAPGPGYLAIEIARLGRFHVTGLDISHTFVEIAGANARREGVSVDFRQGDASAMPFPDDSFDLIVCQAAFKNFSRPDAALAEMYRVLRPGGTAVIHDMRKEASNAAIRAEVAGMRLGPVTAFMTRGALRSLRHRAYAREHFQRLAAASPFGGCAIEAQGIGMEVRLHKAANEEVTTKGMRDEDVA